LSIISTPRIRGRPMGQLRDKMERDMLLKNLSDRTRKTYLACVRDFVRFHRRDPRQLGDEEIKAFLLRIGPAGGQVLRALFAPSGHLQRADPFL
jgi:hypothetical protein